ncbi:hypothetical protein JCM19039_798 [Geomicrobium sp. JCM 19039]|nr:hypothetical protein JCM19039_798 [Geomicrobium sp. JCM 19039]
MMSGKFGNVGVLDLRETKEEAIKGISKIGNVGVVLTRQGGSHLLHQISIGNIGVVVEVEEGYELFLEDLQITRAYLEGLEHPLKATTTSVVTFDRDVTKEMIQQCIADIQYYGQVNIPEELRGSIQTRMTDRGGNIHGYNDEDIKTITKKGTFRLSKSYLENLDQEIHMEVKGVLYIEDDVDEASLQRMSSLSVKGVIELRSRLEPIVTTLLTSKSTVLELIPDDYYVVPKTLKLRDQQLSFWKHKKLFTEKPIFFGKDVARERLVTTITNIKSSSYIVGSSEIEDVLYELADDLETEILAIDNDFIVVDGKEEWDDKAIQGVDEGTSIIINGSLTLAEDVQKETVKTLGPIYLFGKMYVNSGMKLVVKQKLDVDHGSIRTEKNDEGTGNIGVLRI